MTRDDLNKIIMSKSNSILYNSLTGFHEEREHEYVIESNKFKMVIKNPGNELSEELEKLMSPLNLIEENIEKNISDGEYSDIFRKYEINPDNPSDIENVKNRVQSYLTHPGVEKIEEAVLLSLTRLDMEPKQMVNVYSQ